MIFILIILGLLPSLIWLSIYLRQDAHPEPKRLVLEVFLLGGVAAFGAAFLELVILCSIFPSFILPPCLAAQAPGQAFDLLPFFEIQAQGFWPIFLRDLLAIALVEELIKFMVVKYRILGRPEFDEPSDAMLYMIIAALGFAAVENVFVVAQEEVLAEGLNLAGRIILFRFVGATFLHTLASGIVGYALARSYFVPHPRYFWLIPGLALASIVHFLYNKGIDLLRSEDMILGISPLFGLAALLLFSGIIIFALLKELRRISFAHAFKTPE